MSDEEWISIRHGAEHQIGFYRCATKLALHLAFCPMLYCSNSPTSVLAHHDKSERIWDRSMHSLCFLNLPSFEPQPISAFASGFARRNAATENTLWRGNARFREPTKYIGYESLRQLQATIFASAAKIIFRIHCRAKRSAAQQFREAVRTVMCIWDIYLLVSCTKLAPKAEICKN